MLLLTSGKIVTRDQFKILPMPQSVIQTLNSWAIREGKKITKSKTHVFDELLFANSVDKSNMPLFITNPPTQDGVVDSESRNKPTGPQPQPVIADLPRADSVIELSQYEVGGGGTCGTGTWYYGPSTASTGRHRLPSIDTRITAHPPRGTGCDRDTN